MSFSQQISRPKVREFAKKMPPWRNKASEYVRVIVHDFPEATGHPERPATNGVYAQGHRSN